MSQRRNSAGFARRLAGFVLTDQLATANAIKHFFLLAAVHLIWALLFVYSAFAGTMTYGAMQFMIAVKLTGALAVYCCLRSGRAAHLQDSGLVLPQIVWTSFSAVAGFALAPTLRPALLQAMCMVQIFGFFGLRPRQLVISGCSAIALLAAVLALGGAGAVPEFTLQQELYPALLTILVLAAIMLITIQHSSRRGALREQKHQLDEAVGAVRDLVVRDSLTGLFNRRHMQELLGDERARARRTGRPFAVALLDLDHFKRINDGHGHGTGDEVLRRFAEVATLSMRKSDTIARWGGEEFLVLMPETASADDALSPLQRLQLNMAQQDTASLLSRLRVTFSGGVAFYLPSEPPEQVVACADRALYAAKAAGRNRWLIDELPSLRPLPAAESRDSVADCGSSR